MMRSLWFDAPQADERAPRTLTRERVVAAALMLISEEGVESLTMRTLGARLGVVPGALTATSVVRSSCRT